MVFRTSSRPPSLRRSPSQGVRGAPGLRAHEDRALDLLAHADAIRVSLGQTTIIPLLTVMSAQGVKLGRLPERNGVMIGRMLAQIRQGCPICGMDKGHHDRKKHLKDAERRNDDHLLRWVRKIR